MEHWKGQDQGRYIHRCKAFDFWNQWFQVCLKAPLGQQVGQSLSWLNRLCSGIVGNQCRQWPSKAAAWFKSRHRRSQSCNLLAFAQGLGSITVDDLHVTGKGKAAVYHCPTLFALTLKNSVGVENRQ